MKYFILILIVVFFIGSCYKEKDYGIDAASNKNLFTVSIDKSSLLADSFSIVRLTVSFDKSIDTLKASTTVKADPGYIIESGSLTYTTFPRYNYDSLKYLISIRIKSLLKVDDMNISITVGNYTKNVVVNLRQAFPQQTKLTANTLSVKPKNNQEGEIVFTNKISRFLGYPSFASIVDMIVSDSDYHRIGSFRIYNNRSDLAGFTNYTYVLGDSIANGNNYTGKLFAISKVTSDPAIGDTLRDTLIIISAK